MSEVVLTIRTDGSSAPSADNSMSDSHQPVDSEGGDPVLSAEDIVAGATPATCCCIPDLLTDGCMSPEGAAEHYSRVAYIPNHLPELFMDRLQRHKEQLPDDTYTDWLKVHEKLKEFGGPTATSCSTTASTTRTLDYL